MFQKKKMNRLFPTLPTDPDFIFRSQDDHVGSTLFSTKTEQTNPRFDLEISNDIFMQTPTSPIGHRSFANQIVTGILNNTYGSPPTPTLHETKKTFCHIEVLLL